MDKPIVLQEVAIPDLKQQAKELFLNGEIDPIKGWINMSRFSQAVEELKKDDDIKDFVLTELAKYGPETTFGDCILQQIEAGVKYDYSVCNDSTIEELHRQQKVIMEKIKEREKMLKTMPASGLADPETGEIIYPPVKTSKTTIKTTFKHG